MMSCEHVLVRLLYYSGVASGTIICAVTEPGPREKNRKIAVIQFCSPRSPPIAATATGFKTDCAALARVSAMRQQLVRELRKRELGDIRARDLSESIQSAV